MVMWQQWRHLILVAMALFVALFVLGLSIWKQVDDTAMRKVLPRGIVVEVFEPGNLQEFDLAFEVEEEILPTKLSYLPSAARDRLVLWFTQDSEKRVEALMKLAEKRMKAAQLLYMDGDGVVALRTAVKGVHYWDEAVHIVLNEREGLTQETWHSYTLERGLVYEAMLLRMKDGVSEVARPGIDELLETLRRQIGRLMD
jgi:hypothetical protein